MLLPAPPNPFRLVTEPRVTFSPPGRSGNGNPATVTSEFRFAGAAEKVAGVSPAKGSTCKSARSKVVSCARSLAGLPSAASVAQPSITWRLVRICPLPEIMNPVPKAVPPQSAPR